MAITGVFRGAGGGRRPFGLHRPAAHWTARRAGQLVAAATSATLVVLTLGTGVATASTPITPLATEGFTGATTADSNWVVPVAQAGYMNRACMTAGSDTSQSPIPACASTAIDTAPNGTLRLTDNSNGQVGSVYNTVSLPGSQGLDITFNTYQYNGTSVTGADGISFILAATDPSDPHPPLVDGPFGGSLGYSAQGTATPGVSYGYLGFGVDVFGNFANSAFGGTGCAASSAVPENITVRGPGTGTAGYCIVQTAGIGGNGSLDDKAATSRPAAVPVEIAVNPGGAVASTASGLSVPASSFAMEVTPIGGTPQVVTGPLPTGSALQSLGFPSDWFDSSTGMPYQLTFGWAASTGGSNEYHEINTLDSKTLNGQVPVYNLSVADNESGSLVAGGNATIIVTPTVDSAQGAEPDILTVKTTLPAGLTAGTATGTGYSCSTAGQTVTCTYDPGATPVAAGTALPIEIPVTVADGASGSLPITAKVSSNDSLPATLSQDVSVSDFTASASPASAAYGSATTLSAGLPAAASGDVVFTSSGTTLCTASAPAYTCTAPADLGPATYAVTATLNDPKYGDLTTTTSFQVVKAAAPFTASASGSPAPYGTAVTLSETGLAADATGSVTFAAGGVTLCTIADVTAASSCQAPTSLAPATYSVTATYSGDTNYAGSTATTSFTVSKGATDALTASATPASATYGTSVTLGFSGLPADATGSMTFSSGGTVLCTVADVTAATSCTTATNLGVTTYPTTAGYSGDANYQSGTAGTSFTITKVSSPLFSASAGEASIDYGTAETLSFSGLAAGATGSVTFASGGTTLCTVSDVSKASSCRTSASLPAGTYPVTATYSGDPTHAGATADTTYTVTKAVAGSVAATARAHSIAQGQSQTLTLSGLPADATGTIMFNANGKTLCTATLPATSCTARGLGAGSYHVTAVYSGDANYLRTTADVSFTVTPAPKTTTTTSAPPGTTQTASIRGASGARAVTIGTKPKHGTARIVDGELVYTPARGFAGIDSVTVKVVHADGSISYQTVRLLVRAAARASASAPSSGQGALANTGAPVRSLLVAAATLVGAGAVLLTLAGRPLPTRVRNRHRDGR
jgi:hypothetical protein